MSTRAVRVRICDQRNASLVIEETRTAEKALRALEVTERSQVGAAAGKGLMSAKKLMGHWLVAFASVDSVDFIVS